MDVNNFIRTTENGDGCEHWVDKQLPTSEDHGLMEKDDDVSSCCLGNEGLTVSSGNTVTIKDVDSSPSELLEALPAKEQNDSVHSSKEFGVIEQAGLKDGKPHKVAAKTTNQKLSSLKTGATTGLKKVKDGKNGTIVPESRSKESLGIRPKSKSSNDNQTSDLRVKHHKPIPGAANVKYPKQSGQAQPISPSASVSHNETHMEKTKLRLVKKSGSSKSEGTAQSSSPTSSEEKTRNVGALPAYSFSFKCDERAEKRREFYSKLEEKIQAKEAEKSNLQEKSKETHEAELKMLRKTLMFKATPMPSFYQEPAPPKTELKKIPPTRAKSPKLGRRKSSQTQVSEEESDAKTHPSKSLDEKLAQSIIAKSSPINNVKRPLRKSLPKLPSQKTISPNETKRPSARKTSLSKEAIQSAPQQNKSSDESSEAAADVQKQENEAIIDPSQTAIDNKIEPVADSEAEASLVSDNACGSLNGPLLMSRVY